MHMRSWFSSSVAWNLKQSVSFTNSTISISRLYVMTESGGYLYFLDIFKLLSNPCPRQSWMFKLSSSNFARISVSSYLFLVNWLFYSFVPYKQCQECSQTEYSSIYLFLPYRILQIERFFYKILLFHFEFWRKSNVERTSQSLCSNNWGW